MRNYKSPEEVNSNLKGGIPYHNFSIAMDYLNYNPNSENHLFGEYCLECKYFHYDDPVLGYDYRCCGIPKIFDTNKNNYIIVDGSFGLCDLFSKKKVVNKHNSSSDYGGSGRDAGFTSDPYKSRFGGRRIEPTIPEQEEPIDVPDQGEKTDDNNQNNGMGAILWFIIVGVIINFIVKNWIYIVTISNICILCAIICYIIKLKSYKPGWKIFCTILISIILICFSLYFIPLIKDGPSIGRTLNTTTRIFSFSNIKNNYVFIILIVIICILLFISIIASVHFLRKKRNNKKLKKLFKKMFKKNKHK